MRVKPAKRRIIEIEHVYNIQLVTKLINKTMKHGKKTIAQKHVYNAIEKLSSKTKQKPSESLEQAIKNITPTVEVRSRRVGGANYQVPVQVPEYRQVTLAVRWVVDAARSKKGKPYSDALFGELMDAYNKTGSVMKKKEDVLRMAEASKAFSHFAW